MAVTEESEKRVREHRAAAEEYARAVANGEDVGDPPVLAVDGDVGETGTPDNVVTEVKDSDVDNKPTAKAKK